MIVDHKNEDWGLSERGMKDAKRHLDKIIEQIKAKASDVIAEEAIITSDRSGRKVRIPIRGMKDYYFRHGKQEDGEGGQGKGKGKGSGDGEDGGGMEVEVDIDYLIQLVFDELGLPYIEEKTSKATVIPKGWKFDAITKKGNFSQVHKKKSMLEAIKRNLGYADEIVQETGCEEENAFRALVQSNFDIDIAIEHILSNTLDYSIDPNRIFVEDDDLRFNLVEEDVEYISKCVILAGIDSSGSMGKEKKFLCRTFLFWVVKFLEKMYENVEIRFISHTTTAEVVSEKDFFAIGGGGGTETHTCFDMMEKLIEIEYPLNEWNVYCFYSGDGEDWSPQKSIASVKRLIQKKINMFAYAEIIPESEEYYYGGQQLLMHEMKEAWPFQTRTELGTEFCKNTDNHILLCKIKRKEHIKPALKYFLFKEEDSVKKK